MAQIVSITLKAKDEASRTIDSVDGRLASISKRSFSSVSSGISKIGLAAGAAAAGGVLALSAGIASVFKTGVSGAIDLEQQMADIAAVMGKTMDEVLPLQQLIEDLALNPNLKVDTTEAANAIQMLAKNGLDMSQIMDGAALSVVQLSNATGGDFALSADLATDAMNQFNLSASDLGSVVDMAAGVASNSKFDMNDFALALSQAGGIAGTVGVELNDFATTIAATSSLFSSGSDAGTSYKTFLQSLVPSSASAAAAMQELNLITEDGTNAFFTNTGALKSGVEIAGLLQRATASLSEEKKNDALSTIFGTDAMRTAAGLAKLTAIDFANLRNEITENTSASDASATRMNTLKGQMEILKGVVEGLSLQFGNIFIPLIKDATTTLTPMIEAYGTRAVAAVSKFVEILREGRSPITAIRHALIEMGVSTDSTFMGFVNTVASGFAKFKNLVMDGVEKAKEFWKDHGDSITSRLAEFWENLKFNFTQGFLLLSTISRIAMEKISAFWEKYGDDIVFILAKVTAFIKESIALWLPVIQAVLSLLQGDFEGFIRYMATFGAKLGGLIKRIITSINWKGLGRDIVWGIINGIGSMGGSLWNAAYQAGQNALKAIKNSLGIRSPSVVFKTEVGEQMVRGLIVGMDAMKPQLATAAQSTAETAVSNSTQTINNTWNVTARSFSPSREMLPSMAGGI